MIWKKDILFSCFCCFLAFKYMLLLMWYSARSYYYNGDEIEIPIYVALDENILSLEVDFDFSEEVSFLDFTSDYQILESNQDGISLSFADGVGNQDLIGTLKIKISDGLKAYERLVLNFRNITYTNSIGHPVAATEDESVLEKEKIIIWEMFQ